jgi:hypothetical protein
MDINDMICWKTWLKWLPALAGLGAVFCITGSDKRQIHTSPASAAASGLSSNAQSNFPAIYKKEVSNVGLQTTSDLHSGKSYQELESGFLYGYIILGVQNKQVTYDLHLKHIRISADWDDAVLSFSTEGNWGYVYIPHLNITNPNNNSGLGQINAGEYFPLEYPEPYRWNLSVMPGIPCAFLEVLDQQNKLLLIGFNSCK